MAAGLPRPAERIDMRYQWTTRLLANPPVECDAVMRPSVAEAIRHAGGGAGGGTVVLVPDQSRISARHRMPVLAVRVGERAPPLARRVRATRGAIGFAEQRELLTRVAAWLPAGGRVVLMGDRFFCDTPDLISAPARRKRAPAHRPKELARGRTRPPSARDPAPTPLGRLAKLMDSKLRGAQIPG